MSVYGVLPTFRNKKCFRLWPIYLLLAHYFLLYFNYFYPRTKYELDRMNRFRDMAICALILCIQTLALYKSFIYLLTYLLELHTRRLTAAILDLVQPEIAPFDPPTSKTLYILEPNMKRIGWAVAEIWPFEIFQNSRSVGRSSVLNIYIVLMCTPLRYVIGT